MSILIFIVILGILVVSHEFGHFMAARYFKIKVEEFGFGYPPRALKLFKRGDTTFTLNWLPFGGFVKIFGENPDDESINGPDKEKSFVNKPKYAQAIVLIAGVVANFLLAWLLISIGLMSGFPASVSGEDGASVQNASLVILDVSEESPAQIAGLQTGDIITSLSRGENVITAPDPDTARAFIQEENGAPLFLSYTRGDEAQTIEIDPVGMTSETPIIGVQMDYIGVIKLPFFKALGEGFMTSVDMTKAIAVSLYSLVRDSFVGKADISQITGPVGIVGVVKDAYDFGFVYLLSFTAVISLNLAVINLIPFPALDGGRLLFLLIEKIKGSRIKPQVANIMNAIGFFILIALMLFVTYHDIVKLVK